MYRSTILIAIYVIFSTPLVALSADEDIALTKQVILEVRGKKGKYSVSSEVSVHHVYLSERSTWVTDFIVPESGASKVSKLKAKYNGKKVNKKAITSGVLDPGDSFFSDSKYFGISFPSTLKPGDTVSYSYKVKYNDIAFLPVIDVPNLNYLERLEVMIRHPRGCEVYPEFFFVRDSIPLTIVRTDDRETVLSVDSLAYVPEVGYHPFSDLHALILCRLVREGEDMNPVSGDSFLRWYGNLVNLQPDGNQLHDQDLESDLAVATTAREKLAIMYDFVRSHIRYIIDQRSGYGIQPFEPTQVLEDRYGDCKDRTYLIMALAARERIKVDFTLVTKEPGILFEGVHPNLFDHVIGSYIDDDRRVFFDPTARHIPFGKLPASVIGRGAFILDQENPHWELIGSPTDDPDMTINIDASLDSLSRAKAVIVLKNGPQYRALHWNKESGSKRQEQNFESIITSRFYKIGLDFFKIALSEPDSLVLHALADLSGFVIQSPRRSYFPRDPFLVLSNDILARESDALPIFFGSGEKLKLNIKLRRVMGTIVPDSVSIGRPGFVLFDSKVVQLDSNTYSFTYAWDRPLKLYADEKKIALLAYCREYFEEKRNLYYLEGEQ